VLYAQGVVLRVLYGVAVYFLKNTITTGCNIVIFFKKYTQGVVPYYNLL